ALSFTPLRPPTPPLFPYTTLFRSYGEPSHASAAEDVFRQTLRPEESAEHDALRGVAVRAERQHTIADIRDHQQPLSRSPACAHRSEEHTSELQSLTNLVCRLLLEK